MSVKEINLQEAITIVSEQFPEAHRYVKNHYHYVVSNHDTLGSGSSAEEAWIKAAEYVKEVTE